MESPQQQLPVWLTGLGDLYQLVNVCEVAPRLWLCCIKLFSSTKLWIVAPLPLVSTHLLEHQPTQPTKGQWPTPVTVGMRSPMKSPQQQLPVWIVGCGRLNQLVNVSNNNTVLLLHTLCKSMQVLLVVILPLAPMHLLGHPTLTYCTKGQWRTPVKPDTGSLQESPQQQLPVWLMESGSLYQLVQVWLNEFFYFIIVSITYSCGLWCTSHCYQWISWITNTWDKIWRDSVIHM